MRATAGRYLQYLVYVHLENPFGDRYLRSVYPCAIVARERGALFHYNSHSRISLNVMLFPLLLDCVD